MNRNKLFALPLVAISVVSGCAGMVAGSESWFERKRSDVEPKAAADLTCDGSKIQFTAVAGGDYREVEANGCGKKAKYKLVKVAFIENWVKSE